MDKFEKHNQFSEFITDMDKAKLLKYLDKAEPLASSRS